MLFKKQSTYPIKLDEKTTHLATCYHYIHKQNTPELVERLNQNALFTFKHPETDALLPFSYPCLFEDENKQFLVILIPKGFELTDDITPSLFETDHTDYSNYTMRLTTSVPEFLDMINMLDSHYRDTEIECVKLLTHTLLRDQNINAIDLFFYFENECPEFYVVTDKGESLVTEYKQELVDIVNKRVGDKLNLSKGSLHQVNKLWAADALELR